MYIGGGSIFWLLGYGTLNTIIEFDKAGDYARGLINLTKIISPMLVWIWICWRFV